MWTKNLKSSSIAVRVKGSQYFFYIVQQVLTNAICNMKKLKEIHGKKGVKFPLLADCAPDLERQENQLRLFHKIKSFS